LRGSRLLLWTDPADAGAATPSHKAFRGGIAGVLYALLGLVLVSRTAGA
jgi:hypothetical protein